MGFLSRRLKRNRRRALVPHSNDRSDDSSSSQASPIVRILRAFGFLAFCIVWSSFTFPRSSGWRADLRVAIEKKLGLKPSSVKGNSKPASIFQDTATLFENDGDGLATPEIATTKRHQQHRIPCGLIVIDDNTVPTSSIGGIFKDDEDRVLPLTTSATVPMYKIKSTSSTADFHTHSTLHARALAKYPRLQSYVVPVPPSSSPRHETTGMYFKRMIPEGTFRLRMGSEESTIEDSPPLWIIEDEAGGGSENDSIQIDLVLGTTFWKDHLAEFGNDEVYLNPTLLSSETNTDEMKLSRVMIPFLRMRSRPSFGTEDL